MTEQRSEKQILTECARKLLSAMDMMNDGPDDSDKAWAEARLGEAVLLADEWRRGVKNGVF